MARLKQVEVLRQRISEVTGMPIGDIDAQNSRYILRKNNLHLPGLSISVTKSSTANRKSSEDDEVEILNESVISVLPIEEPKKQPAAGASSNSSGNFKGSCPLCGLVFECLILLETYANACNGQSAD